MIVNIDGVATNVATGSQNIDPARPNLILVHGAANDRNAWRDLMPALASSNLNIFAPDLPGHGLSGGTSLDSIESIAKWLLALANALGLQKFALAGHSMGSLAALEAAARGGDQISHLALLGTSVPMPVSDVLLETARNRPDAACRMVLGWSHTPNFLLAGGGGHGVWGPGKTLAVMRSNSTTLAGDLSNCNNYTTGFDTAARVKCPTLLVLGKRDKMAPPRAVQPLQDALKTVKRLEIADCGHAMMVEKPQEVAAALLDFMR